ncbi:serine hydrolase [[Mycoplasma] testudinis]|uniref:serine hydrolase n=1 Tax=[Mycoplasma] testudinis TaxID=33924 RepID=UPI00048334EE|nr:serine hydrolase [[Mycoplasma] testudinis]
MENNVRGSFKVNFNGSTIDNLVGQFMEENGVDGLALSIVQAPYISRVVNYGSAGVNLNGEKLVSGNTVFPIGKISQGYMAIAVMQAYEEGLLDLNDPITKFFKGADQIFSSITIKNLLQHTSGLVDFTKLSTYNLYNSYEKIDILRMILGHLPVFDVNTKIARNPSNFYLLSLIIDHVTKMPYEEYVTKNQFERLRLKNTFFAKDKQAKEIQENLAEIKKHENFKHDMNFIDGYEFAASQDKNAYLDLNLRGYSDVYASAYEISFWDIALAGTILVKEANNRKFIYSSFNLNGQEYNASCGWQFTRSKGFMDIYDNEAGYTTYLSRFTAPEDLVCVTILTTKGGLHVTELARQIAACFKTDLSIAANQNDFISVESHLPAQLTYEKLRKLILSKKNTIFAEIDHQKNAKGANLELGFSKVVVFGNPVAGTHLMQEHPWMATLLPLSISVYEDLNKNVWVSCDNISSFADKYQLQNKKEVLKNIKNVVNEIINKATSVY